MSIGIDLSIGASSGGGGGSVNTGVLQISGGAPLSGTLQTITDQSNNSSLLRLSTTQLAFAGFATAPTADIVWRTNPTLTDYTGWHQTDGTFRILTKNNASLFINIASSILFSNGLSAQSIMSSNGALGLGIASTPSARLHVRGDGTNPIARFEDSTGTAQILQYETTGRLFGQTTNSALEMLRFQRNANRYLSYNAIGRFLIFSDSGGVPDGDTNYKWVNFSHSINTITSGTQTQLGLDTAISVSSGNPTIRIAGLNYTINNAGANTGVATGIFLNATETALNGMTHNLMDLQLGGVSQFRVDRIGGVTSNGTFTSLNSYTNFIGNRFQLSTGLASNRTLLVAVGEGIIRISDATENAFNRINLGGITNAFPAIKRNGAAIDFRLADDSAFCKIEFGNDSRARGAFRFLDSSGNNAAIFYGDGLTNGLRTFWMNNGQILFSGNPSGGLVSAAIQIDSTTQGFLPPRMTTTQINAIVTPAEGLVVYNTTISHLCVYQAGAWVKLSHSPM